MLVLEEGPLVRQGEVVPFSLEQMERQYRAGGVTVALGRPSIAYTEGCCAGGGTEINSGLYRRPPEEVVDRWRTRYGVRDLDPGDLYAICDEVERELSVQTVPGAHTPASEALRRGAAALGWRHDEIPRWMDYTSGPDARARPPAQHDRDVPPTGRGRRCPPPYRPPRPPVRARRRPGDPGRDHHGRRPGGDGRLRPCRRVRRGDPDSRPAPALGDPPPGRPDPRRAPHGEARRPVRRPGQRSRRRPGPSGQGVRAGPVLRRLGVRARPRRPRPQRLVGPVPRRRERLAEPRRLLRGHHERRSRPRPSHPAACATRSSRIA